MRHTDTVGYTIILILSCFLFNASFAEDVTLSAGFNPDPYELSGNAGGAVDAASYNDRNRSSDACGGYIDEEPNHVLTLNSAFDYLRIAIQSTGDTTLMVIDESNAVYCYDDQEWLSPVAEGDWQAGRYEIYVGYYDSPNQYLSYNIRFSETANTGISWDEMAVSDTEFSLSPGFTPDPFVVEWVSGGNIDASILNDDNLSGEDCKGYIAMFPDHRMRLTDDFPNLRIWIEGQGDTTLILIDDRNRVYCYDDSDNSLNPSIQGRFVAGNYRLYIGTYEGEYEFTNYTLYVSESR